MHEKVELILAKYAHLLVTANKSEARKIKVEVDSILKTEAELEPKDKMLLAQIDCAVTYMNSSTPQPLPDWFIEAVAGLGDGISHDTTTTIRQMLDISEVDTSSAVYDAAHKVGARFRAKLS